MRKLILFILCLVFLIPIVVQAGDEGFEMYGNMGTVVMTLPDGTKKMYSQVSLQPELTLGKLGIGLDLIIYVDEDGNVRENDWDDWSKVPEKILYIRYAEKGDPFYFYIGGMRAATLGHGMIFNKYSNLLLYPDVRKIAMACDINGGVYGIETITTNIQRAEVLGSRVYYRPLHNSDLLFFDKLAVGISGGLDVDPDDNEATKNDEISIVGADLDVPIFQTDMFSTLVFFDIATMQLGQRYIDAGAKNGGVGTAAGIKGKLLIFDYVAQHKSLQNNFIYGYFDVFYEIDRPIKGYTISGTDKPMKEGPYFELGYSMLNKAKIMASYENFDHDPEDKYPWVHAEIYVDPELLLNKFSFRFTYDRRDANSWDDIVNVENENSIMITEVGYRVGTNVMLMVIEKKTFDQFNRPFRTTSIQTRIKF